MKLTRISLRLRLEFYLAALLLGTVVASEGGVPIPYAIPEDGYVTIAIDNDEGVRVRNLVSAVARVSGNRVETWDGLDDAGQSLPTGTYHWRGLFRKELSSHFLGAFNSPGDPPWNTLERPAGWYLRAGGSGGWLSDHERPLCLYASDKGIFVGASIAEAGHSIIQLDFDGRKKWGTLWLSLSGANAIATDGDVMYVAGEKGWMKNSLAVNRINLKTYGWVENPPHVKKNRTDACFVKESSSDYSGIQGMVVTRQFIILSLADKGRLAFFDRETAKPVRDIPLPEAGAILKEDDTHLLGVSGCQVVEINLESGANRIVIADGLEQPSGLARDSHGRIYVGDNALSEQCVKVFSSDGKFLHRIGNRGGRREGRFDPQAMGHPVAVAVDSLDQVWVAEHDFLPKRVSVWTGEGKLLRDFIGTPHYGGGGALADANSDKSGMIGADVFGTAGQLNAFYKGLAFAFEEWPKTSRLQAVLYRPEEHADLPYPQSDSVIPHFLVKRDGKNYFIYDDGHGVPGVFICEKIGDKLTPRVIFGNLSTLRKAWAERQTEFLQKNGLSEASPEPQGVFLWQDLDGNGRADPTEISIRRDLRFGALWGMRSWPTLNLYARSGDSIAVISPKNSDGPLSYNLDAAVQIPLPETVVKKGICATCPDPDGGLIINCGGGGNQGDPSNVLLSLSTEGKIRWTYPNPFPANWHNSPLPRTGDILHTLNVEGFASLPGEEGKIFQLNGNKGTRYLFTTDGLFVDELFGDMRTHPVQQNLAHAEKGMRLDKNSLGDECFLGWLGETADGRILQIVGKDSSNVAELKGLDTIQRLLGGAVHLQEVAPLTQSLPTVERGPVKTVMSGGFGLTGEWYNLTRHEFPQENPIAQFAVGFNTRSLCIWLSVTDATPFENGGGDLNTLFHTGDAIDFRWASDPSLPANRIGPGKGDSRFVVAMHGDTPVVVKYTFVDELQTLPPVEFASPTGSEQVARVEVVTTARVNLQREEGKGYTITIDIPWTELGEKSRPDGLRRGDIGVLFGDESGMRTVRRCYYFDQDSQVVSDIPSEVRVSPDRWGEFLF